MRADKAGRWSLAALAFAVAGLAISAYLTVEHYAGSTALACPESATINCVKVTTSHWSRFAGFPVAVLGLVYFAAMTVLVLPPATRQRRLNPARLLGALVGTSMVVYLLWAELFRLDAICLWCTAVHLCTLGLFAAVLWQHTQATGGRHEMCEAETAQLKAPPSS